ncbi:MAG: NAD(P)/FAD-dependent oxidoreductase [Granulosicoccus sp.]
MSTDCECIVIGAGVVGLAIAARLAQAGREVLILEREAGIGNGTSARNSEVIHAGIYYPKGSLKARMCVAGKQLLYRYCEQRYVNHRQCGKLIVATNESQLAELASIQGKALNNGVEDLTLLSETEATAIEPQLRCLAALHSPSTGIIDSHGLMLSLLGDAENHGAVLATRTPVDSFSPQKLSNENQRYGYVVQTGGDDSMLLSSRYLINAAGLGACDLVAGAENLPDTCRPTRVLSKGNYFSLNAPAPFSRLIYPVPEVGGLGVHITIDLAGQARFGPDVQPIDHEDYAVDPSRSESFYSAVRQYWPALADNALMPDYAGIRPKINVEGNLYTDFLIQSEKDHGMPGMVNLFGIESPGLTSCLAIAEYVEQLL